jgi:hypothetical protein
MSAGLFDAFSRMIDGTPVKGILPATERELQILENDLATDRPVPKQEIHSVLVYCSFLQAVKSGVQVAPVVLPPTDTAFYRRTTVRLIAGGELPDAARELFDETFTAPRLASFTNRV